MDNVQREERARWKLKIGGYRVHPPAGGRYLVTSPESITELDDLAQLIAFAEAIYERVWAGRPLTLSA